METRKIRITEIESNRGQVSGLPSNPRQWKRSELENLKRSILETPELFEARGILVYPHEGKYVVLGGNMRLEASRALGLPEVPCIVVPENTPVTKLRELVVKDNGAFGEWDYDMLANEWDDLPLPEWGVPVWESSEMLKENGTLPADEVERKRREFEERMKAGEISEEDEEYQAFLEKFQLKKTTDDCYTPALVYEAIADYVSKRYGIRREDMMRPFYPGGDYQKETYAKDACVVDNPPFSILSEILKFYASRGIKFFLFAPHLTLFSSSSSSSSCALPTGVAITYENGASVNTSFLTNLEPEELRLRSAPDLYAVVKAANEANLALTKKELPKYAYDHHIITSTFIGALSRLGIDFEIPKTESESIDKLESQKTSGKAIYGKGYIVSDRVFAEREKAEREKAEREKAEREKAEREKAERWELSRKEWEIIKKLNANESGKPHTGEQAKPERT